ncbi:MAG: RHS repeat-associated core domain-containing protein, partial [Clostridia bacterium]|nr:RHS repeat-associated core domain-containing protein [Clostridia bacterium]
SPGSTENQGSTENRENTNGTTYNPPLYEKLDENTYVFYSYDGHDRVTAKLEVLKDNITIDENTTFSTAESVAESKVTYVYFSDEDSRVEIQSSYIKNNNTLVLDDMKEYDCDTGFIYGYNKNSNISTLKNSLNGLVQNFGYGYDDEGNITTETLNAVRSDEVGSTVETNETIRYTYDDKKQLTSAETSTIKYEYEYDERGNILNEKEYAVTVDENGEKVYTLIAANTDTYDYDKNWEDKLIKYNGQSITYDAVGNPVEYLGNTLTWSMGRQLATFGNNTYTYNEDGIRTSKTVNNVTTTYYLNGTNIIEQIAGNTVLHFYYDSNDEVIGFEYNSDNYYYVKNAMGDILGIADSAGNLIASYTYDPWGKVLSVTGSDIAIGNLNPFRYRGYYYDAETGLYYLQSRYYDPEVGRFINCDDVNYIGTTGSEISYNPFAYCENNPVNMFDHFGNLSYGIFKAGCRWDGIINWLLRNASVLYKNKLYYPRYASISPSKQELSLRFSKGSNARTYLKSEAQEIYFYKTYSEWCYYISVENKNILKRYSNKAIKRVAKILIKLNKRLTLQEAERMINLRIDEIENVAIPTIDDCFSLNIGFALDVISIASDLIDVYYKKFSKEVRYISRILDSISSKYRSNKYYIFIPFFIYYDYQEFYERSLTRTGIRWRREIRRFY